MKHGSFWSSILDFLSPPTYRGDDPLLIGEPSSTPADLKFSLLGIPVRVHPFFWLVAVVLGASGGRAEPVEVLIWVGVVFVSILVHELGHAVAFIAFGGRPWITLYGMGGLTSCERQPRGMLANVAISFAGPAAGFLFAAITLLSLKLSGKQLYFAPSDFPWIFEPLYRDANVNWLVGNLLFVNILWGLVNLLPVYPLDGGHISRELMLGVNPRRGVVWSLSLSIGAAAAMAVWAIWVQEIFVAFLFGYLAYSSYAAMQAYQRWGGR